MRSFHRLFTLGLLLTAFVAATAAQSTAPDIRKFLGTWRVNVEKSNVKTSQLVVTRETSGDITVVLQGTRQTMRLDGKERPSVLGSSAIWTETSPRSWKTVYRMANVDNNIDEYTLSADGKTLTLKTVYLVPKHSEQTLTFSRVSGGPGLPGVWQTETLQSDPNEFILSSTDGVHVTINWPAWGGTAVAPTNGTEVEVTGSPTAVAPNTRASFKLTGPNTFDLVMKMSGEVFVTDHVTLSADGKVLTLDAIGGPDPAHGDRATIVFNRR